jgi:hypothetical protein
LPQDWCHHPTCLYLCQWALPPLWTYYQMLEPVAGQSGLYALGQAL